MDMVRIIEDTTVTDGDPEVVDMDRIIKDAPVKDWDPEVVDMDADMVRIIEDAPVADGALELVMWVIMDPPQKHRIIERIACNHNRRQRWPLLIYY